MSWSITAAGSPEQATAGVAGASVPEDQPQGEIAREAIKGLLATVPEGSTVLVSASGHHDDRYGDVSIGVNYGPTSPANAGGC
jgi:hypothetical protein